MGAAGRAWAERLIVSLGLKGAEAAVALALGDFCYDTIKGKTNNRVWPKKKELALRAGCHHKTVRRATKSLERHGWLEILETKRNDGSSSSNTYVLRTEQREPDQPDLFEHMASLGGDGEALGTNNRLAGQCLGEGTAPNVVVLHVDVHPGGGKMHPPPVHDAPRGARGAPPYDLTLTGSDQSLNLDHPSLNLEEAFQSFMAWYRGLGGHGSEAEARPAWHEMNGEERLEEGIARPGFESWRADTGPKGGGGWYNLPSAKNYLKRLSWRQAGDPREAAAAAAAAAFTARLDRDGVAARSDGTWAVKVSTPEWRAWEVAGENAQGTLRTSFWSRFRVWTFPSRWPPEDETNQTERAET